MQIRPFLFAVVSALACSACNRETPAPVLQDKRKDELTRELAADLLNKKLAHSTVEVLLLSNAGLEKAVRDGILAEIKEQPGSIRQTWRTGDYRFTEKGLKVAGSLVTEQNNKVWGGPRSSLKPHFKLNAPIAQRVGRITGIVATPIMGITSVEYETAFVVPADVNREFFSYFYSGNKADAGFQKYDDGWRLIERN